MKLQELEFAKRIWESDKYIDINNFHYDCSVCEERYDQFGHTYIDNDGNKVSIDCSIDKDHINDGHVSDNNTDNHEKLQYKIYPIQIWNETKCKTCEIIDYLCNMYYIDHLTNTEERNNQIIEEILSYEINAYKLLKQRESFGFVYQQLDGSIKNDEYVEGIYDITHYLYNTDYSQYELDSLKNIDIDINETRIDQARWCSVCGARKPNIIFDDK